MSNHWGKSYWTFRILTVCLCLVFAAGSAFAQQERRLIRRVEPIYPDLARTNRIKGAVKLRLVVGRDGRVKSAEPLGGHPLLIEAALSAVEQWKYEAAGEETKLTVEFKLGSEEEKK